MTPERSMDERVARIAGWRNYANSNGHVYFFSQETMAASYMKSQLTATEERGGEENAPPYSTSVDAAMQAYEVMRERGWNMWQAQDYGGRGERAHWRVELARPSEEAQGYGPTLAMAICSAIESAAGKEKV